MPNRVLSLLLAFVMLWSGFAVQEHALSTLTTDALWSLAAPDATAEDGSTADPQRNDRPAQAQIESLADGQVLLSEGTETPLPALTMARPRAQAASDWVAPWLDGLQRPPCVTAVPV